MRKRNWSMLVVDLVVSALLVLSIWIYNYKIPHLYAATIPSMNSNGMTSIATGVLGNSEKWHAKFADHFSETVISTDDTYKSANISIQLSHCSYDTMKTDSSENGKHTKYGTKIAYTVADIYIGDITCLQTGFAKDTFGIGYEEELSSMSARMKAVLAINGDSYNNNRHKDNGTIIRNGKVYRDKSTDMETCVLNYDGTMQIYQPNTYTAQQLIDNGAYQSWIFGPSLLEESGNRKTSFLTWDYIRESHPRTAIGYYESGHYCFVVVDGRQKNYSRGMFLEEESKLFADLGCKVAYNLDGGHSSFLLKEDVTVSSPYKPNHPVPDGIFITEGV